MLWLCTPLVLLVTLRGDTRDTLNYIDAFRSTTSFPWNPLEYYAAFGMEWGYGLSSWALNAMGLGPQALFFLISLGTFYFLQKAANSVRLDLIDLAPYYLGSYFLVQQLMQIRQGLATAIVLSTIALAGSASAQLWRTTATSLLALGMHVTSALPLMGAQLLNRTLPHPTRWRIALWLALILGTTVLLARMFMSFEVIESLGRLSVYATDEEYNEARGLLDPANVRGALLLGLLISAAPAQLLRNRTYTLLLGLYAAHLGIRLGFFDFLILSGRLSTALGVVEVLLLPMLLKARISSPSLRAVLGLLYLIVHASATLVVQAPFLINDYFTPLHTYSSAP